MERVRRVRAAVMVAALSAAALGGMPARAEEATCADPKADRGEWRMYGHDLRNSRTQPVPQAIVPGNVGNLGTAWVFNTDGAGGMQNTPVVADGCVYIATNLGAVFAINAETGEQVWKRQLQGGAAGSLVGGIITGSPVVHGGRVYVAVSELHNPRVVALDQHDKGKVLWDVPVLDDAKRPAAGSSYRNTVVAAPVIWKDMLFQGIMADEANAVARGGYAILDIRPGTPDADRLIRQEWTVDDAEYAAGYRGASIWCTAAVDEATDQVYACGGNPASKQKEPRYSNSLIKIDMKPGSPTFGEIVAGYKGETDQYYPGLDRQPACDQVPTTLVWSPTCAQLDLDFGASPNLFTDEVGRATVGALQKSGIYHTLFADNMQRLWTTVLSGPCFACNASSAAVDVNAAGEGRVFAAATPGVVWGLSKNFGRYRWAGPFGSGTHFQSVSAASGVVYTVSNTGELHAFDATSGLVLARRNLMSDAGGYAGDLSSQGVAIARDTVYAASGPFVVALR